MASPRTPRSLPLGAAEQSGATIGVPRVPARHDPSRMAAPHAPGVRSVLGVPEGNSQSPRPRQRRRRGLRYAPDRDLAVHVAGDDPAAIRSEGHGAESAVVAMKRLHGL